MVKEKGRTRLASAPLSAIRLQTWAPSIKNPIPDNAIHWISVGEFQTKSNDILENNNPNTLLINKICKTCSLVDNILININSNPITTAAISASNAAGSKAEAEGRRRTKAPSSPIHAAVHLNIPIFSPSKGNAKIMANTGFKKLIAVASETGMIAAAVNIAVTALYPHNVLMT